MIYYYIGYSCEVIYQNWTLSEMALGETKKANKMMQYTLNSDGAKIAKSKKFIIFMGHSFYLMMELILLKKNMTVTFC